MSEVIGKPVVFHASDVDQGQDPFRVNPGEQFEGLEPGGVVAIGENLVGVRGHQPTSQDQPARGVGWVVIEFVGTSSSRVTMKVIGLAFGSISRPSKR